MRPSSTALIRASRQLRAGGQHIPHWSERPYGYVHQPKPHFFQVAWGKALGVFMWTFIFWRAYEDKGVAFGIQQPFQAHPPHDHHDEHGHDEHGHDDAHH